jgi:CO/xanthine dehydrogenase FAD-binding subunit
MRPFDYYQPESFDEAFKLLTMPDKVVMPLAGSTDLIPMVRDERWSPDIVVDIKELPGLRDIKPVAGGPGCGVCEGECLYVGAAVRMSEIARSPLVNRHWGVLAQAAGAVGHEQVRNRATLGGNMGTASPAGDTLSALLVLEAEVLIQGAGGERCIPVTKFFLGPRKTALRPGEIIVAVLLPPLPEGSAGSYERLSRRRGADLALVGVSALAVPYAGGYQWRLALCAVAPTPIRVPEAEAVLSAGHDAVSLEQAAQLALAASHPIDDVRATAAYRREMVVRLTRRALQHVVEQLEH